MESSSPPAILALNLGSSSIKLSVFAISTGQPPSEADELLRETLARSSAQADDVLADVARKVRDHRLVAIGHRIVFGGETHVAPELVTDRLIDDLERFVALVPLHLPREIELVRNAARSFEGVPQVACFDTAFHAGMPAVARRLPVPRALWESGVRRYGFHGLSYEYVVDRLGVDAQGRVIVAHLGSGASLAAIRDGKPVDTTMGFSALGGVMMATRPGDLDPGVILYLLRSGYSADALSEFLEERCGLLGVSELSSNVVELLPERERDARAAEALELFVYNVRKGIGALTAVLGGLDLLVFTGGIGENAVALREAIVDGLAPPLPRTRVVRTNENLVVARHAYTVLELGSRVAPNIRAEPIR